MTIYNIFDQEGYQALTQRIKALTPETQAQWGKMHVDQMLAHCNVAFDYTYTDKYTPASGIKRLLLKWFVKPAVVNETPYPKNGRTGPDFIIADRKNFEAEQQKLLGYLEKKYHLGESHFEGKSYHSFGVMTAQEWNNSFAKHLDHHLTQFGV